MCRSYQAAAVYLEMHQPGRLDFRWCPGVREIRSDDCVLDPDAHAGSWDSHTRSGALPHLEPFLKLLQRLVLQIHKFWGKLWAPRRDLAHRPGKKVRRSRSGSHAEMICVLKSLSQRTLEPAGMSSWKKGIRALSSGRTAASSMAWDSMPLMIAGFRLTITMSFFPTRSSGE